MTPLIAKLRQLAAAAREVMRRLDSGELVLGAGACWDAEGAVCGVGHVLAAAGFQPAAGALYADNAAALLAFLEVEGEAPRELRLLLEHARRTAFENDLATDAERPARVADQLEALALEADALARQALGRPHAEHNAASTEDADGTE